MNIIIGLIIGLIIGGFINAGLYYGLSITTLPFLVAGVIVPTVISGFSASLIETKDPCEGVNCQNEGTCSKWNL